MQYRVLGPVEVVDDGRVIALSAAKELLVLSALLASPNRVVPIERLLDELWAEHAPRTANKIVQTYVSHLRKALGERLATTPGGYLLRVADGELDSAEFERVVGAG